MTTIDEASKGLLSATSVAIAPHRSTAVDISEAARAIEIHTQEDYELAGHVLLEVKRRIHALDAERKKITTPLHEAWQATNRLFRGPLDLLEGAERAIKEKIGGYTMATRARQLEALAAPQAGPVVEVPATPEPAKGVSTRSVVRWDVTDPEKVPRAFLSPDPRKIQAHLDAGGVQAIPGVRFWDDIQVIGRAGK